MLTYLITSLPKLNPNEPPPFTRSELASRIEAYLRPGQLPDFHLLFLLRDISAATRRRQRRLMGLPPLPEDEVEEKNPTYEVPEWVNADLPHQVRLRRWYQSLYQRAQTNFLSNWARTNLNLEEMISGHLCKRAHLKHAAFMEEMEGGFDSTWRVMVRDYEEVDLGISLRVPRYAEVVEALDADDILRMEFQLNQVRWYVIERCMTGDTFSLDFLLAYYLKLQILERQASFDAHIGEAKLEEILAPPEEIL